MARPLKKSERLKLLLPLTPIKWSIREGAPTNVSRNEMAFGLRKKPPPYPPRTLLAVKLGKGRLEEFQFRVNLLLENEEGREEQQFA